MSDIKNREHLEHEISPVDKWKHFQDNYGKKGCHWPGASPDR